MKRKLFLYVGVTLWIIALTLLVIIAQGQEKPKTPVPVADAVQSYEATEVENLRLQVIQRDAQLAQIAAQQANAQFQKTVNEFNAEVETIKKAHNWPAGVQVDPVALSKTNEIKFVAPPPPLPPPGTPTGPPVEPAKKP